MPGTHAGMDARTFFSLVRRGLGVTGAMFNRCSYSHLTVKSRSWPVSMC